MMPPSAFTPEQSNDVAYLRVVACSNPRLTAALVGITDCQRTWQERRCLIIAVHEAGHAIAGYLLGARVELIDIGCVRDRETVGETRTRLPLEDREDRLRAPISEQALYHRAVITKAYAGIAAEDLVFGGVSSGYNDDMRAIAGHLRVLQAEFGIDTDHMHYRKRAALLLRRAHEALVELAAELLQSVTVADDEAHSLVERACAGLDIAHPRRRANQCPAPKSQSRIRSVRRP
ncbi:MAG TPA: hypothetical protein VGS58_22515 [Candidatus Sulfopaludibacter sp.]|nr:hypothetical protein [Candidatus Sulfopaludibacter sp.]